MPTAADDSAPVVVTTADAIATVRLNRRWAHNALDTRTWGHLADAFDALAADPSTRVIVLTGERSFSSGADLDEIERLLLTDKANGNDAQARAYWRLVDRANTAIEHCPKPVIALVKRFALGAGCALAIACDYVVMAENAKMGIPAVQRGLTLGVNDTRRLVSRVGVRDAREILIFGRHYLGADAVRIGLANELASLREIEARVEALARHLAIEHAPLAMREAKANILEVLRNPGLADTDDLSRPIAWAGSDDLLEGIRALRERRPPAFRGL
jgi:enoyl-CoA hydratase